MIRIKKNINLKIVMFILSTSLLTFMSCSVDEAILTEVTSQEMNDTNFEVTDWTTATHSDDAHPDFDEVFEDNTVKRLDIGFKQLKFGPYHLII